MTEDRNKESNGAQFIRGTSSQPYPEYVFRPVNGEQEAGSDEQMEEDLILGDEALQGDEEEYEIILEEDDDFGDAGYDEDDLVIDTEED